MVRSVMIPNNRIYFKIGHLLYKTLYAGCQVYYRKRRKLVNKSSDNIWQGNLVISFQLSPFKSLLTRVLQLDILPAHQVCRVLQIGILPAHQVLSRLLQRNILENGIMIWSSNWRVNPSPYKIRDSCQYQIKSSTINVCRLRNFLLTTRWWCKITRSLPCKVIVCRRPKHSSWRAFMYPTNNNDAFLSTDCICAIAVKKTVKSIMR